MSKTYETLMARVRELTRKAHRAREREQKVITAAVARIRALMKEHGVTIAHLTGSGGGAKVAGARGAARLSRNDGRRSVKPKYRHPKSGQTWAGRGKTPRWLVAEMKAGKKRDDFLIKSR